MTKVFAAALAVALVTARAPLARAADPVPVPAHRVVVLVFDGMRPDFISAETTPNLWKLAQQGVFFAHHHPVYLSSTEVNGTAIATGAYPSRSTVIANFDFRPPIDPQKPVGIEVPVTVERGDKVSGGNYHRRAHGCRDPARPRPLDGHRGVEADRAPTRPKAKGRGPRRLAGPFWRVQLSLLPKGPRSPSFSAPFRPSPRERTRLRATPGRPGLSLGAYGGRNRPRTRFFGSRSQISPSTQPGPGRRSRLRPSNQVTLTWAGSSRSSTDGA